MIKNIIYVLLVIFLVGCSSQRHTPRNKPCDCPVIKDNPRYKSK